MAMATAMLIPRAGLVMAPINVASPSGKLWIAIASAENIPMRRSFLLSEGFRFFSSIFFIS